MESSTFQRIMAYALGVVYLWFGLLKFFHGMSPAEDLVISTVDSLFFGIFPANVSIHIVAAWEVLLGLLLFTGWQMKWVVILVLIHMAFTFTPLFLFPELCFDPFPVLSLVGQYIVKNLVLVVGAITLLSKD